MIYELNSEKMQHAEGRCSEAYMTVEASLLIPMVLCVLMIGIYMAFFLYDRCLLSQDSYLLCLRESYRKESGSPSVDTDSMNEEVSDLLGEKYLALKNLNASAEADGTRAIYEGTASAAPAVFGEYFLMPKDLWTISFSSSAQKNDPAWSIRSWRRKSRILIYGVNYLTGLTDDE